MKKLVIVGIGIVLIIIGIFLYIKEPVIEEEIQWFDLKKEILPIVLLVDESTYQNLENEINQFARDIESDVGTDVRIFHKDYINAKEVKNHLLDIKQELNFEGIILVGEIPIPLITTKAYKTPAPSDSYYADLENIYQYEEKIEELAEIGGAEEWGWDEATEGETPQEAPTEMQSNLVPTSKPEMQFLSSKETLYFHVTHSRGFAEGDIKTWIGRITAPVGADNKIQLIKEYLNRNHKYRTGELKYNDEVLVFMPSENVGCMEEFTPEQCSEMIKKNLPETYFFDNESIKTLIYRQVEDEILTQTYLNEIKKPYSAVLINAHGGYKKHEPDVRYTYIQDTQPQSMFYEIGSCLSGAFQVKNNIAQWYLFSGNSLFVRAYSVVIMSGSLIHGGGKQHNILSMGGRIYEAYPTGNFRIMLGDPTLKIREIDTGCNLVFSEKFIDFGTVSYPFVHEESGRSLYFKNIGSEKCIISLIHSFQTNVGSYPWFSKEISPQETIELPHLSIKGIAIFEIESSEKVFNRSGSLIIISNDPENIVKIPYRGKINKTN
ncbi:hypothetical protein KAR52_03035 [Candidatus Pacearchaeota archaeon]|nr:hypothetical protein [Candidatus Pacearchaeota archaeon]